MIDLSKSPCLYYGGKIESSLFIRKELVRLGRAVALGLPPDLISELDDPDEPLEVFVETKNIESNEQIDGVEYSDSVQLKDDQEVKDAIRLFLDNGIRYVAELMYNHLKDKGRPVRDEYSKYARRCCYALHAECAHEGQPAPPELLWLTMEVLKLDEGDGGVGGVGCLAINQEGTAVDEKSRVDHVKGSRGVYGFDRAAQIDAQSLYESKSLSSHELKEILDEDGKNGQESNATLNNYRKLEQYRWLVLSKWCELMRKDFDGISEKDYQKLIEYFFNQEAP